MAIRLHVTAVPGLNVMTAIRSSPEGRGQTKDHWAKPKIQALNPGWARRDLLERHDLHGDRADHDEPRRHRREHAHFTACEDRYRGYKRTPSDGNRQHECRNGVIAERRVLKPLVIALNDRTKLLG